MARGEGKRVEYACSLCSFSCNARDHIQIHVRGHPASLVQLAVSHLVQLELSCKATVIEAESRQIKVRDVRWDKRETAAGRGCE